MAAGAIIFKVLLSFLIIGLVPYMAAFIYEEKTPCHNCPLLYKAASTFTAIYSIVFVFFIVTVIMSFCMAIVAFLWTI